ncbi:hypothetical protein C8F01DRAFT_1111349, partial [Mycena amicta]
MARAGAAASRREVITTPATWPEFSKLTALAHYVDALFSSVVDPMEHFPSLTHVEIWPDDLSRFYPGLQGASRHLGLDTLTLWSLLQEDIPLQSVPSTHWPVFPNVRTLVLNKTTALSSAARLAVLLAKAFPALRAIQILDALRPSVDRTATSAEEMTRLKRAFERTLEETHRGGVRCTF